MPKLVPSILENAKDQFLDKESRETKLPGVERIQVDFGDGVFVPNKILPVTEIDTLNPAFHWEAHLMIKEPEDFLDYQICGFKTIIIHYEAYPSETKLHSALQNIKSMGFEPVICLKADTEIAVLKDFSGEVKHFQLMGVEPGFQGSPFIEQTVDRIKELRELIPNAIIEIDGGINETNIKKVADAGADLIVLGSAITKVSDMLAAWEKLNSVLSAG